VLLTGGWDMFRASPGSVNANDAVSGAGQTAPLAQARARARASWALPLSPPDVRPRSPGGIARSRVDGQGIALTAELAAQSPSLHLFAEAVAP
jgi:hypothetical protein